jgi:DNA-binding CsgD family transcriptional regulator
MAAGLPKWRICKNDTSSSANGRLRGSFLFITIDVMDFIPRIIRRDVVTMEKKVAIIERLQQLFADSSGYSIWILDQAGKLMTRPIFATEEGRHIYETVGSSILPMSSSLLRYGLADGPVIMDLGDSVWQIVSAVTRDRNYQYYYICAGPMKVDDDKGDLIHRAEQFKELLGVYLQQEQERDTDKIRGKALERLAEQMQRGGMDIDEIDGVLSGAGVRYDYLGYASKTEGFQYKVSYTAGRLGDKLQGAAFFAGEGYLGQLAVTGKMNWWTCKPGDPRLRFFAEHDLAPSLLYGFPVKRNGSTVGLLFYGFVKGTASPQSDDLHMYWSSVICSLLGEGMTRRMLQANLELQTSRISTLIETAGVLSSVRDITRIMHLLIDMALTLFPDAQATICLVKQPDNGKICMVSRGLSENKAERFGRVLTHKYLQPDPNISSYELENSLMKGTTQSVISYSEDALGVICVDHGDGKLSQETGPLLDTLSRMGAVAISQSFSHLSTDKSTITLLYDAMLQLDPAKSALVSVCRDVALLFGKYLQLEHHQLQKIDDAAALIGYDPEFLRSNAIQEEILDILTGCRRLDKEGMGDTSYPIESRILNCVKKYVASGGSNSAVADDINEQFQSFLLYRERMSRELAVTGIREDRDSSDQHEQVVEGAEFASLSPREIDVLKLIAEGSSNKRIAETLFISEHTVKNHITNIFSKLGVADRSHLIAMVYRERNQSRIAGAKE